MQNLFKNLKGLLISLHAYFKAINLHTRKLRYLLIEVALRGIMISFGNMKDALQNDQVQALKVAEGIHPALRISKCEKGKEQYCSLKLKA